MMIITGAGGTLGSEVVKQLQSENVPFRAAYFSKNKTNISRAKGIDAVTIDYNSPDTLLAAFRGMNKLFLLAPSTLDQTQMELNAVLAAKATGIQHIVKQSGWKANEEEYSFAKFVHRQVEKAIESSGIAWTFLRPNNFMQNIMNYMGDSIRANGKFFSAAGGARISHIDARDIAAVAVKALTEPGHEGKAYSLSGPESLTYDEMARDLSRVMKRLIAHVNLSPRTMRRGLLAMNMPKEYADWLLDLDRYFSEGKAGEVTNTVKQITGHDPIRFEQHARDYVFLLQRAA